MLTITANEWTMAKFLQLRMPWMLGMLAPAEQAFHLKHSFFNRKNKGST